MSLILRTPWLQGGESECGQPGRLEIALRDRVRIEFRLHECLPMAEKMAPQFAAILAVLIEQSQQVSAMGLRPAADWAHWLTDLLKATGWPGDVSLDSESWQTLQAWNKLLAAFAAAGEQREEISHQGAVSILAQLAHEQLYQAEGPPHGVQVMGVLEAAGHQFDQLWVGGMARELWPVTAKPNPYIPLALQRRVGMPGCDAGQTLAYTERLTQRLLGSAASVVVSWPGQLDGEELAVSPLIGVVNRQETTWVDSSWNQQMLNHGEPEWLSDDKVPPVVEDGCSRGGTALLNLQAVSPLNAFIEKRLGQRRFAGLRSELMRYVAATLPTRRWSCFTGL
jgi:ATP-dependent helicase/nuclease subunit B